MYSKAISLMGLNAHSPEPYAVLYILLKALAAGDSTGEAMTPANVADGILSRLETLTGEHRDSCAGLKAVQNLLAEHREQFARGQ